MPFDQNGRYVPGVPQGGAPGFNPPANNSNGKSNQGNTYTAAPGFSMGNAAPQQMQGPSAPQTPNGGNVPGMNPTGPKPGSTPGMMPGLTMTPKPQVSNVNPNLTFNSQMLGGNRPGFNFRIPQGFNLFNGQEQQGSHQITGPQPVNYNPYQYMQPQAPQQSVEQSVHNNSPQSVQNFMTALNKVGAGSNNRFMNGAGQQGQGPTAGFQGFGVNGQQGNFGPNAQFNVMGSQLGQAGVNANYGQFGQGGGVFGGGTGGIPFGGPGTGGVAGQGQYKEPDPWSNSQNVAAGVQGSKYGDVYTPQGGWDSLTDAHGNDPAIQGAYYSGAAPNTPGTTTVLPVVTNSGVEALPYGADKLGVTQSTHDQTTVDPNQSGQAFDGYIPSDIRAKKNIKSGDQELEDFLSALGIYSYEYKDKKHGEGRRISPMAQEIESTKLGKNAVAEDHEGVKRVDYGKLMGTQLSALAMVNNKVNHLEELLHEVVSKNKNSIIKNIKNKRKGK